MSPTIRTVTRATLAMAANRMSMRPEAVLYMLYSRQQGRYRQQRQRRYQNQHGPRNRPQSSLSPRRKDLRSSRQFTALWQRSTRNLLSRKCGANVPKYHSSGTTCIESASTMFWKRPAHVTNMYKQSQNTLHKYVYIDVPHHHEIHCGCSGLKCCSNKNQLLSIDTYLARAN